MVGINHSLDVTSNPEQAFAALTTQKGINAWWSKDATIGAVEGAEQELNFIKEGNKVSMAFVVNKLTPGATVKWTCTANPNPAWIGTTLEWKIAERDGGARVDFVHEGFKENESAGFKMTAGGWNHFMGSLKTHLCGGEGQPW